ncbi:ABC transporter ATP-binding protein [Noviherbaspirillum aridicola]|uniref:ABC transporter ATP-binding protein n=1 Tax=Noviherbaspirillum aridicola TaxID=2849687 RepID=A0ABQ4Q540_9BURK|nr:ABC transporter ATP-binding protein [Noviherbaspirillum aridicola]GIZ52136.1 ABC transporter ATP-binding protein [Noviherbaspirillum aridicola]
MRTEHLSLRAGKRVLIDNLNWETGPGECWCIIGRNGAGKSTLLRTLAGLREPDAGVVTMDGQALRGWPLTALARRRAYLPQGRNDAFGYRALDTVLAARHPCQEGSYWDADADRQAAHDALRLLDADHLAMRDVRSLSGGERQRVAIAATLAQDTPLLLLDEPASALDLAHQVGMMRLLSRLTAEGRSIVIVSHDLSLAHEVATHALLLMGDGRWHAGTVAQSMQPALLGECLGYPVEAVRHKGRTIFIPEEDRRHG